MQCDIVYCTVLQAVPHALQILMPTPHWEKWITQVIPFFYILIFFIPKYYYVFVG